MPFESEVKRQAVMALCTRQVSASEIARCIGVSRAVLYKWKDEIIGNSAYQTMRKHNEPSLEAERDALREEVARLNQEIRRRQMELDILKKAEEIIKKDPGISISHLNNREKTKIADALRQTYPLTELLHVLGLARSSYFYHRAALKAGDKYATIRTMLTDIFNSNYQCYGYRRLHAMLRHEGGRLSEKVVRRLMVEEQLVVSRNRRRRYSSYCGEIGPAPDNLIARDFKAEQPNQKWLTDITEFQLPAGKVWLSPVVDCFDCSSQLILATRPGCSWKSLFRILCKCLFSEVTVQAVTELDNKAAHCHSPVLQRHRPFLGRRLDCQPHHFFHRVVCREHFTLFDRMADHAV